MEALEKVAFIGAIERALLLRTIGREFGPTASRYLRANPLELQGIQSLLKEVPRGGTRGTLNFSSVAPGFARNVLGGRKVGGEAMNRLLPAKKRLYQAPNEPDVKSKVLEFLRGAPAPSDTIGAPAKHTGGMALPIIGGAGLASLMLRSGRTEENKGIHF